MKAPDEKTKETMKGPGGQDSVSSGRSDMGQKKEQVNYGYENGIAKPEAQVQDGENPDEDERNKEWQERAKANLEKTPSDTITNIKRDFEPEDGEDNSHKNESFY
ncbi:MAG: hypothetical protein H7Y03_13225 [Chitinophagaceae bacterium]|nr:hypothetical protein [Chitinophagaceae bacterium]